MTAGRFTIASLFPERLNIHGDAENADVLRVRAGWRGLDAEVATIQDPADAEGLRPAAITIGAGFDADGPEVLAQLRAIEGQLREWMDAGAVLLAVGLGWELLSRSTELHAGAPSAGLGFFSGRWVSAQRRVGRIVIDSAWGALTGYEYHLRDYVPGDDEEALGTVVSGTGNSVPNGPEGAVRGNAYGTGIRGPVLARNPAFADHLLERAAAHAGLAFPDGVTDDRMRSADVHAERANAIVRRALGLPA